MNPATESDIRASFVNCSKGEAKRLPVLRDLADLPWDDLDFLGWRDPAAPDRGYLVGEHGSRLVGVVLRSAARRTRDVTRRSLCSLCVTSHPAGGVELMSARKAGAAGRQGDSAGVHMCADLACPLYVRGIKSPAAGGRLPEDMTLDEQIERTASRVGTFLSRVLG
ncbi:FBP domain-containing protein [Streptomonospora litoralis]|uniref:FBP domain-containing protein n=1 Tax=Streptomonospora litoralis TaxID=2498135 RepID=UPI0010369564|nr:FBP domain-containing protein [Streptomonospora litoralis]